jgi:hypothetical protein
MASKRCSIIAEVQHHRCAPAEKSVINMISLVLSVSNLPIIMIRPGGLLLVVPHLFALPVSVLWFGVAKEYIIKLGCEKYFCGFTY